MNRSTRYVLHITGTLLELHGSDLKNANDAVLAVWRCTGGGKTCEPFRFETARPL
jgi:hypothetical protein